MSHCLLLIADPRRLPDPECLDRSLRERGIEPEWDSLPLFEMPDFTWSGTVRDFEFLVQGEGLASPEMLAAEMGVVPRGNEVAYALRSGTSLSSRGISAWMTAFAVQTSHGWVQEESSGEVFGADTVLAFALETWSLVTDDYGL